MTYEELVDQLVMDMRRQQILAEQNRSPALLDVGGSYGDMPMATPMASEFIGNRVMQSDPNQLPSQMVAPIFMGAGDPQGTVQLNAGGGSMASQGMRGYSGGGRLAVNLPINENYNTSLGVTGGGANVRFGMGTPDEGRSNMFKIQGIDAVLRDIARNQEFGAGVQRSMQNDPFYSLYYRKNF
jgi:hypothetical protein